MPDDRFIHPRLGQSIKVGNLTDLQFRVWATYILASDDCGVMRASALSLQNANVALESRPDEVKDALEAVIACGLVHVFHHQGRRFIYQRDLQDWQKVRYPRASLNPDPPPDVILLCSKATQKLFRIRSERAQEDSGSPSESLPSPAGAGGRERLAANGKRLTANGKEGAEEKKPKPGEVFDGGGDPHPPKPEKTLSALHRGHFMCGKRSTHCIPSVLHEDFENQLAGRFGGDTGKSREYLERWYLTVWAMLPPEEIAGDLFVFWRDKFGAEFGTKRVKPTTTGPPGPRDCKHAPRCLTDAAHTMRYLDDQRRYAS